LHNFFFVYFEVC